LGDYSFVNVTPIVGYILNPSGTIPKIDPTILTLRHQPYLAAYVLRVLAVLG
jgi:hypothetical protein